MMKTTLDLPDALVKQVKVRALQQGLKLKDAVADLLRKGLAVDDGPSAPAAQLVKDRQTGLPLIECQHPAAPDEEMTPDLVADVLLGQEVRWHAGR